MNRKKITILLMVLYSALIAEGCSGSHKGVVVGKEHRDAWTQPMVTLAGKTPITTMIHHPERWTLTLSDKGKKGQCNVTRKEYFTIKIGDWYECNN